MIDQKLRTTDANNGNDPTDREHEVSPWVAGEIKKAVGGRPRSEVTGRHDAGSGANETIDGLNSLDESLRQAAEGVLEETLPENIEDVPVFDRANLPPKV